MGGAVEKRWFELGKHFATQGHQVVHISRRHAQLPKQEIIRGVSHIRVRGYDTPSSLIHLKLLDLLYTQRALRTAPPADILISNTFWAPLLAPARAGKIYVDVARVPKGQIRFYKRAVRLRANSTPVAEAIVEQCPTTKPRVKIIPNPLPFSPSRQPDFEQKENRLLYTGRIHPEKGIEILLRAFHQYDAFANWKLCLVGPWETGQGGGGKEYKQKLQQQFDNPHIEWLGPIFDTDQLNAQYERAKIFVYPSVAEKGETFGLAPLEAMAWGCAPVVSNLRCFQDFIIDGQNGFIFDHRTADPAATCREAIKTAIAQWKTTGQTAMKVRESHSLEKIGEDFLADFASLLDGSASTDNKIR